MRISHCDDFDFSKCFVGPSIFFDFEISKYMFVYFLCPHRDLIEDETYVISLVLKFFMASTMNFISTEVMVIIHVQILQLVHGLLVC